MKKIKIVFDTMIVYFMAFALLFVIGIGWLFDNFFKQVRRKK